MIQDAVTAGLLLQRPLEARLNQVIESATSTYLETLDDGDRATAKLHVHKTKLGSEQLGTARAGHHKPDSRSPRTSQFGFSRRRQ